MTVSRVINSSAAVRPDKRARVERAIEELGYVPNRLARGLSARRLGVIAVLVPDLTNPFFTEIVHKIEDVANEQGLTVVLGNSDERPEREADFLQDRRGASSRRRDHRRDGRWCGCECAAAPERRDPGGRARPPRRKAGHRHRARCGLRARAAAHTASDPARSQADRDDRRSGERLDEPRARRGLSPGASRGRPRRGSVSVSGNRGSAAPMGRASDASSSSIPTARRRC